MNPADEFSAFLMLATLSCGLLVGALLAITFFVAPLLHRYLKKEIAAALTLRLFPVTQIYYTVLALMTGVFLGIDGYARMALASAILAASFVFCRTHLLRAIRAMYPGVGESAGFRFRLLRSAAVLIVCLQSVTAVWILLALLRFLSNT